MSVKPMNTLFIFSDQHNRNIMGCMGNEMAKTPNLDKLAEEGVLFTNAYCNFPICVPSRASMTTGRYAHDIGSWGNAYPYAGEAPGFGHRLTEQGYKVTTIGKLHYKGNVPETGFPDQRIPLNVKDGIGDPHGEIRSIKASKPQLQAALFEANYGESEYTKYDRKNAEEAIKFFENDVKNAEKPWTLFVGFATPHFPLIAPKKFYDMYPLDEIEIPSDYYMKDRPMHKFVEEFRRYGGFNSEMSEYEIKKAIAAYCALCSFTDEQIGRVIDGLKDAGLSENTRIIYTSDHGHMLGEHGLWFKHLMYEGSVGIPFIMAGPDLPKGKVIDEPVSLIDIFPTIMDGAGAAMTEEEKRLPGISLLPVAKGAKCPNRTIFAEYHALSSLNAYYMLRRDQYKYIYYVDGDPQLFDLKNDPKEMNDLAQDENYKCILEAFEKELRLIVDPEKVDKDAKESQRRVVEANGGEEKLLNIGVTWIFSPTPLSE